MSRKRIAQTVPQAVEDHGPGCDGPLNCICDPAGIDVDRLWGRYVSARPVPRDWFDPDAEGAWTYAEGAWCDVCGELVAIYQDESGMRHCEIEPDSSCNGEVTGTDGPIINEAYPVDLATIYEVVPDLRDAAALIADLPLCIVQHDDDTCELALTGGGMDLSWEIAEAYVRLGFLPPLYFADLPLLGGLTLTPERELIVRACERSAKVARRRAEYVSDSLAALRDQLSEAR